MLVSDLKDKNIKSGEKVVTNAEAKAYLVLLPVNCFTRRYVEGVSKAPLIPRKNLIRGIVTLQ